MKPTVLLLSAALLSSSVAIATTQTTAFTYLISFVPQLKKLLV